MAMKITLSPIPHLAKPLLCVCVCVCDAPVRSPAIVGGGSGTFIGALIIYCTKSKGRNVALINWTVTLVALFPIMIFIVHCPTLELVGVKVEYPDG